MPKGFTLIEVLVVMVIISIVTTVALLSVGRNQTKVMQGVITDFTQSLSLAEEQAMLAPAVLGVSVNGQAWRFFQRLNQQAVAWEPVSDDGLNPRSIPENIAVNLQVLGRSMPDAGAAPQIIISSNGDITPFTLTIGVRGKPPQFQVKGAVDGSLSTERLS